MNVLRSAATAVAGLTAVTAAAGVPAAGAQSSSSSSAPVDSPALSSTTGEIVDGSRSYRFELPRNYDPARPYPVIIGFGGWQHRAEFFAAYSDLDRAAGEDAIVVYARGIADAWEGAPYSATARGEDVSYVRELVDDLAGQYAVDRERVFAVGLSNGGGMAAALACQAPDLVAGVVSVAGAHYYPTISGCTAGSVPAMTVHGTNDDVIDYDGGTRHGAPYASAEEVFHHFGRRNGCTMDQIQAADAVLRSTVFTPTECEAATAHVRVDGGGHTWFTIPDTATLTADFFRAL